VIGGTHHIREVMKMADIKSNLLVTLVFDENTDIRKQVDTELKFKEQVIKDLQHLIAGREIKHFIIADDEVINKKLIEERKVGKWVFTKTIFDKYGCTAECPSCHKKWKTYDEIRFEKENKFCPNCGNRNGRC
jgi:hypothetical protein